MPRISFRENGPWRGMTTQTLADLGDHRFKLLEDCYHSSDGHELRMRPGWKTVYDFVQNGRGTGPNGVGYYVDTDAKSTPVYEVTSDFYRDWITHADFTRRLKVHSQPVRYHCVRRVGNRLVVVADDDFEREPILNSGLTAYVTVTAWTSASQTVLTLSANWRDGTIQPNGIATECVVFLAGAGLPAALANKFHRVVALPAANTVQLDTATVDSGSGINASIDIVRVGRAYASFDYPVGQHDPTGTDDVPSLTVYWSLERPEIDNVRTTCYPSHVFNRMRDSGDESATIFQDGTAVTSIRGGTLYNAGVANPVGATSFTLATPMPMAVADYYVGWLVRMDSLTTSYGIVTANNAAATDFTVAGGWSNGTPTAPTTARFGGLPFSRRRQKSIPWRLNPDVAGDTLLLAAPAYGCVFQVPCRLPNDPTLAATGNGLQIHSNDFLDRPRALGVVKGYQWIDTDQSASSAHLYEVTVWQDAATGATSSNLTVAGTPWSVDQFVGYGYYVRMTSGAASGQYSAITTNTTSDVTFSPAFTVAPGIGDTFVIERRGYAFQTGVTYRFAVNYRDDGTDEVGRLSESLALAVTPPVIDSGTANVAVTYTATTLDDTRENWIPNEHIGRTVTAGASTGVITDNDSNTLTVASWSGGTPAAQTAWTINGRDAGVRIFPMHPGYVQAESGALRPQVYHSIANGTTLYHAGTPNLNTFLYPRTGPSPPYAAQFDALASSKYGLAAITANQIGTNLFPKLWQFDVPNIGDTALQLRDAATNIETQPAGASCAKTIRGSTIFGGRIGNAGTALELYRSTLTAQYEGSSGAINTAYNNEKQVTLRNQFTNPTSGQNQDGEWGCANSTIPSAYEALPATLSGRTFLPYPALTVELDTQDNGAAPTPDTAAPSTTQTGGRGRQQDWVRFLVDESPLVKEDAANPVKIWAPGKEGVEAYLKLPQSVYQWSPQGDPGVVLATNLGYIDSHEDANIEGIFAYGGAVILCTRSDAYILHWTDEPRGTPDLAAEGFGCIAPRSEVHFDGGTAWISDRGPVAFTGAGPEWIGRDLEAFFVGRTARYKRDRYGRMWHSFSCHDPDRGLILMGVFADREAATAYRVTMPGVTAAELGTQVNWDTASDQARSTFPCDEILVYSYRVKAWTRWVPPVGMEWCDAWLDVDTSGANRVCFLDREGRIHALDDYFNDGNKDAILTGPTAAGSGTTITLGSTIGGALANRGSSDDFVRVGMKVAIIRTTDPSGITALSTITSFTSNTITLADSVTWTASDFILIGFRSMTAETNFVTRAQAQGEQQSSLARYSLASLITLGGSVVPQLAYGRAQVVVPRRIDDPDDGVPFHTAIISQEDETLPLGYKNLGASVAEANTTVYPMTLNTGKVGGLEYSLRMHFVGGAQIKLSDLQLEV